VIRLIMHPAGGSAEAIERLRSDEQS
jgi:hypothetical protein